MKRHPGLIDRCAREVPSVLEIDALSVLLHSFYTGVENIFKRVALAKGEGLTGGDSWHREILDSMARPAANRPAVISEGMREMLRGYLQFRHVFRHAYSWQLQWTKMSSLVASVECAYAELKTELDRFVERVGS